MIHFLTCSKDVDERTEKKEKRQAGCLRSKGRSFSSRSLEDSREWRIHAGGSIPSANLAVVKGRSRREGGEENSSHCKSWTIVLSGSARGGNQLSVTDHKRTDCVQLSLGRDRDFTVYDRTMETVIARFIRHVLSPTKVSSSIRVKFNSVCCLSGCLCVDKNSRIARAGAE